MLTLIISLILIALLYLGLYLSERRKRLHKAQRRMRGINTLQCAVGLMTAIQQHRGMSVSLLNGNETFRPGLINKQTDVRTVMTRLEAQLVEIPEFEPDRLTLHKLRSEWERLVESYQGMTGGQSFSAHTDLVRKIIHLIGDMGEHLGLMDNEGTLLAQLSNLLLLRLPLLMESIGQARALGSGYATEGQVGAVGRIRLSFLENHIRECRENINLPGNLGNIATAKIESLLELLEKEFIRSEEVKISPEQFFKSATETIEACLKLWQDVAQHTEMAVGKPKPPAAVEQSEEDFSEYKR
jgi:hypothetical protein